MGKAVRVRSHSAHRSKTNRLAYLPNIFGIGKLLIDFEIYVRGIMASIWGATLKKHLSSITHWLWDCQYWRLLFVSMNSAPPVESAIKNISQRWETLSSTMWRSWWKYGGRWPKDENIKLAFNLLPDARPVPLGYRHHGIRYSIVMTPHVHFCCRPTSYITRWPPDGRK